ncbi:MAG TPA: HAMP domain-containing sensor histidine kinase [Ilumatobacteraceae bacterium]|nr:HAMP domain-containing sensor histidine kinase [Ilumatobacteraceae bacterium]
MSRRALLSPLGVRLAAAFVVVAVAALTVLAALVVVGARSGVSELVADIQDEDARAAAVAAAQAYEQAAGWPGADLATAVAIAARGQATLAVRDADGRLLSASTDELAEMMLRMHGVQVVDTDRGDPVRAAVMVDDVRVGDVELRFPDSRLPTPERQIRSVLFRNLLLGALLAVAVAVAVAVFVARRVTRPIVALTAAVEGVGAGEPGVRVDLADAPGELRTLAATFNQMAAAVEREDQLRKQLVADVAHELRTPLTILRGTTEALVDGVAEADDATLGSLHEEVLRLALLVDDLHTLAAADAANLHVRRAEVDLVPIVASVADVASGAADMAGIDLQTVLEEAHALVDSERVKQIVSTLIGNALVYTPTGGTITLRTGIEDDAALIAVSDSGPGIEPEDLPHIFDRFYRGTTAQGIGSGIGLAVARELAVALGGDISAGNGPAGGAVFTVRLPIPGQDQHRHR